MRCEWLWCRGESSRPQSRQVNLRMDVPRTSDNPPYHTRFNPRNPFNQYRGPRANVNLGDSNSKNLLAKPQFPKDDANISKRATPESLNKRPCRHCGSGKHWDYECKYSRRGERMARVNFTERSPEELEEQQDYDDAYYGLDSDIEDFQ